MSWKDLAKTTIFYAGCAGAIVMAAVSVGASAYRMGQKDAYNSIAGTLEKLITKEDSEKKEEEEAE